MVQYGHSQDCRPQTCQMGKKAIFPQFSLCFQDCISHFSSFLHFRLGPLVTPLPNQGINFNLKIVIMHLLADFFSEKLVVIDKIVKYTISYTIMVQIVIIHNISSSGASGSVDLDESTLIILLLALILLAFTLALFPGTLRQP